MKKRAPAALVISLDPSMSEPDIQAAIDRAAPAQRYVVGAFASVASYRGSVALGGSYPKVLETLIATKKPVMLVALGNPYLLRSFPGVSAYMTTYSSVPVAEVSAVRALFGEIAIGGKLPVTIPGFAQYGDGITIAATKQPVN
jgi:beta-N-acetylhexosaminidase